MSNKKVVITEELAGAVLTMIRLGTFPFQYAQIKEVEAALLAAVANAGVEVIEASNDEAIADVVEDFPGGVV